MDCVRIFQELLLLVTFLWVHSNSKEVSYLIWQNMYLNLKTTCHIKLKVFLWTKLVENLLFAKYFISVAATLRSNRNKQKYNFHYAVIVTSPISKFVDFTKIKIYMYQERNIFSSNKKCINYTTSTTLWQKNTFVAEVPFKTLKSSPRTTTAKMENQHFLVNYVLKMLVT